MRPNKSNGEIPRLSFRFVQTVQQNQFERRSVDLLTGPRNLAELFGALVEDRRHEVDVDEQSFFLHQLRKCLFDAFARASLVYGDVSSVWPDRVLAFLGRLCFPTILLFRLRCKF